MTLNEVVLKDLDRPLKLLLEQGMNEKRKLAALCPLQTCMGSGWGSEVRILSSAVYQIGFFMIRGPDE